VAGYLRSFGILSGESIEAEVPKNLEASITYMNRMGNPVKLDQLDLVVILNPTTSFALDSDLMSRRSFIQFILSHSSEGRTSSLTAIGNLRCPVNQMNFGALQVAGKFTTHEGF
jgi:hypothetical protein